MNYRLIIRIEAEVDITDAAIWYQNQGPGLGEQFVGEAEVAIERIVANPRQYPRLRRKPEVRRVLTGHFPYRIFFIVRNDAVVVFRVLHAARHDREWKKTLPKN